MRTNISSRALLSVLCPVLLGMLAACSGAPPSNDDASSTEESSAITGTEQGAYNFFVSKGLTSYQAAGIVGNLMQESNVEPGAVQPGGPGRGIAQWSVGGRWNADRNDNLESYVRAHGGSMGSLTTQLEFVWYELETFSSYGLGRLRASRSVSEATVVFQDDFEGCGQCEQTTRIRYAEAVLRTHGGSSGSGAETCYSATLRRTMPHNACVQSASNHEWYQCANGGWTDRWTDPDACNGVHPL
jgi:hypothetical protein